MNNVKRLLLYVLFPFCIILHLDLAWQSAKCFDLLNLFYLSFPLWILYAIEREARRVTFVLWFLGTHFAYFIFLFMLRYPVDSAFSLAILTPMPLALGIALVRTVVGTVFSEIAKMSESSRRRLSRLK